MIKNIKSTLLILFGVALAVQLTGCLFFGEDEHRRHHDSFEHHDIDHDPSIDVRVHS